MSIVKDLRLESQILPLFDFSQNAFTYDTIRDLMTNPPGSIEGIYERQAILKAFINQRHHIQLFYYFRSEFDSVYRFLNDLVSHQVDYKRNKIQQLIKNFFFGSAEEPLLQNVVKTIVLLHDFQEKYFVKLDIKAFPVSFKEKLENITQVFEEMELSKNRRLFTLGHFNLRKAFHFLDTLAERGTLSNIPLFLKNLTLFEAYLSIASGIEKHKLHFPTLGEDTIMIDGLYHPLLKSPVKSSLHTEKTTILLTGPNMSGKSTFLKALGLCMYLSHLGWAVPAASCKLPFFDELFVFIDSNDDLENGYSHFMVEIQNLKTVLEASQSNKKVFAIFDELFKGTNIDDALVVSSQTINGISKFERCSFFISTHLYQSGNFHLINNARVEPYCLPCSIKDGKPVFSYILEKGWSEIKIGKLLFDNAGLTAILA